MTVYEALAIMLLFGTLIVGILSLTVAIMTLLNGKNNTKK